MIFRAIKNSRFSDDSLSSKTNMINAEIFDISETALIHSGIPTWSSRWSISIFPRCNVSYEVLLRLTADLYRAFEEFRRIHKNNPGRLKWYSMVDGPQIEQWGHQFEEMVVQCTYNNMKCSQLANEAKLDIIQNVTQDYGNCFSFMPKQKIVQPGSKFGEKKEILNVCKICFSSL